MDRSPWTGSCTGLARDILQVGTERGITADVELPEI